MENLTENQLNLLRALIRKQIRSLQWVLDEKELLADKRTELSGKVTEWKEMYKIFFGVEYKKSINKEK